MSNYIMYDGFRWNKNISTGYYCASSTDLAVNGVRPMLHRYTWEKYNGTIPKTHHIHHKDRNKDNNDISNLDCVLIHEHNSEHSKEYCEANKEKIIEHLESIRPLTKEWHSS